MGSSFLFLTIGMLFITGIFCLVFALNKLSTPSGPTNIRPLPQRDEKDGEENGEKTTKLGRPIEEVKLRA